MRDFAKLNVFTTDDSRPNNGVAGVLCLPGQAPVPVKMKKREVMRALRTRGRLMELTVDRGKPMRGCFRSVQFNEEGQEPEYITIERIAPGNELHYSVPIVPIGKPQGYEKGVRVRQQIETLKVLGLARNIPKIVSFDVSELKSGDVVMVRDLDLPTGTQCAPQERGQVVLKCETIET